MLEDIKALLFLEDDSKDAVLEAIIKNVSSQFLLLIGKNDVPSDLTFIVVEVSIARFNRLESEGMTSQSIEGLSMSFTEDLFAPFMRYIDAYLSREAGHNDYTGKLRFL